MPETDLNAHKIQSLRGISFSLLPQQKLCGPGICFLCGISVVFLGAFPQASAPLISPLGSAHVVPPSGKTEKCCKAGSLNFFLSGEIADFVGLI